jgi:uncharacterized membrane protein YheB (UPF0754 family)
MSDAVLQALITIAFGALAGGITNTVAIWMLFHPYRPPKIFGRELSFFQGAVPKNQARLAAAIGRTVGGKLLTDQDLAQTFGRPEFRNAFDHRLQSFMNGLLREERGSLRELIPEAVLPRVEGFLDDVVEHALERLHAYVRSPEFEDAVADRTSDLLEAVEDEPIGGVLTPAREEAIAEAVEEWLASAVESEDFREAVEDYIARATHRCSS